MNLTWSAHISWLFGELPYRERPGAARRAGFRRIETAWPDPPEATLLPELVEEQALEVVLLNCPAGDTAGGERGFLNDPRRRAEAEQGFRSAATLAERLGAPNLNMLLGRALPDIPLATQREAVVETLRALGPEAQARGLRILLEPVNAIENPGYLVPTVDEAVKLIEECGSAGLGVLLDVYHVARAGGDPPAAIASCVDLIGHVQISDCPGRGQPGSGALDIAGILERLAQSGYGGSIGLEYTPAGATTEESLAFLRRGDYAVSP